MNRFERHTALGRPLDAGKTTRRVVSEEIPVRSTTPISRLPPHVHADGDLGALLEQVIAARPLVVVTSAGWITREFPDFVTRATYDSFPAVAAVPSHPMIQDVVTIERSLPPFEMILALGGGSVIDAAKAVSALRALNGNPDRLLGVLTGEAEFPLDFAPAPIVAIPTTAGTGSEVTNWATLWTRDRKKLSLSHPSLKPTSVFLEPELCARMPPSVTLASGLDSASHAMEAIWNVNSTAQSDAWAVAALRSLKTALPDALTDPLDLSNRDEMQIAALNAGLAMSMTQTALAHSISYPLTTEFGMPHGLACSVTLGEVAHFNAQTRPDRVALVADAFDCELEELRNEIYHWMISLGVPKHIRHFISDPKANMSHLDLLNPARAANNIRQATRADASKLLHDSLLILAK